MAELPKWTARGQGKCPKCFHPYSTAWKPKKCKGCGFEIGGEYVPKEKKRRTATSPVGAILVAMHDTTQVISVKRGYRDNRVFVVNENNSFVCHYDECKDARAVSMASPAGISFSCPHVNIATSPSPPLSQCNLTTEDITNYPCDQNTKTTLSSITPPEKFYHIVHLSDSCYAVFTDPSTTCPTGYTHILQNPDQSFCCTAKQCNRKKGTAKQLKTRPVCLHLHILFCHLQLSLPPSNSSHELSNNSSDTHEATLSTSRKSTIQLNLNRSIPYPLPTSYIHACNTLDNSEGWPTLFCPTEVNCGLCGSKLSGPRLHPGQNANSPGFLITPRYKFKEIEIKVKICPNCKAMHQVWPIEEGLLNISDKILLALEFLVNWRELFRRGVPITIAIESNLQVWLEISQVQVDINYFTDLLYNGFYAFEVLSQRSLDNVICGICGVVGQAYFGDGNEKNCCSLSGVTFAKDDKISEVTGIPSSLEEFLEDIKSVFIEKISFTSSLQTREIDAYSIPPIIAPALRGNVVYNTECQKKSVYLNGNASAENNMPTFTEQPQRPMWHYYILGIIAVLFPVFVSTMWILFGGMYSGKNVISRDTVYLTCKSDTTAKGLFLRIVSVVFLSALAFLTTVFAYKTKTISQLQKFREAKHIAYAMLVFMVTLLIFYPGWTLIQGPVLQVFSCLMNIIATLGIGLCSFGPKVRIMLVYPVLNSYFHVHPVRKSVQAVALGAGLTLLTTGKGRSATVIEDSPTHTTSLPTTTTSFT